MSSAEVLEIDVANTTPAELEAFTRELNRERCRQEAVMATHVHRVWLAGAHLLDGHRTPKAWGRATCNWSGPEAARLVRLGAMLERFPSAAVLAADGRLGVAQMHALASVVANPRVRLHLQASEELLVGQATQLDFDDYAAFLAQWEALADEDGAHDSHERAHSRRRATAAVVGNQFVLDAFGGAANGAVMLEILNAFAQSEWYADWETGRAQHGDSMCPALMERTDGQRRFDALYAIFLKASAMDGDATGSGPTVNIVVGEEVFHHHLEKLLGGDPHPADPNDANNRCETDTGVRVDPYDMLIAAAIGHSRRVVLDSASVVIDMGRKQRLFTGPLRDAILMGHRRCIWPGCYRPASACEADHVLPWGTDGPTRAANGAPTCGHHNRWRTRGYRTWRDDRGHWHHARPDGTEIGWRADASEPAIA